MVSCPLLVAHGPTRSRAAVWTLGEFLLGSGRLHTALPVDPCSPLLLAGTPSLMTALFMESSPCPAS